jgi:hypothetical protein
MEKYAHDGKFQLIGNKMSMTDFTTFEYAATTIGRSDKSSQEDRTTLGTIRRYGIVAEAIIMMGGLAGELKSGGIKIGSANTPVVDDDEEGSVDVQVNVNEVKRYIKLTKDSLEDIYNVVKPILNL